MAAAPPPARIGWAVHWSRWAAPALIVLLGALAYANSLRVPFLLDDFPSIVHNERVHASWPPGETWLARQADGITTAGRPLLTLSLAFNYAWSGEAVWSYHVVNLLIHLGSALLLFAVARRLLSRSGGPAWTAASASSVASAIALLWALHPVQTAAVTYIVQRAEALAAFWILATLYLFLRGTNRSRPWLWYSGSVVACLLGLATKETAVMAPLLVWLVDRTFVAGSWSTALRARSGYYVAMAASWLIFLWMALVTGGRGSTAGFETDVSAWHYAWTQVEAVLHYLRLAFWPAPLVFDHGRHLVDGPADVAGHLILLLLLLGATAWAIWKRPRWGFLGGWFFLCLAPTSSIVPIATQTMAEHRLYLALAAPVALAVVALHRICRPGVFAALILLLSLAALAGTMARNAVYQSPLALWRSTLQHRPDNARAHHNYAQALFETGEFASALHHYDEALRLQPSPDTHYNRGLALGRLQRWDEATEAYRAALTLAPHHAEAANNLGTTWMILRQPAQAAEAFRAAVSSKPAFALAHSNLSAALLEMGQATAAVTAAEEALHWQPALGDAHYNLGNALAATGQPSRALAAYEKAIALDPSRADIWFNSGNALLELDRLGEAAERFERAVQVHPGFDRARALLVRLQAHLGRYDVALAHARALLAANPNDPDLRAQVRQLEVLTEDAPR